MASQLRVTNIEPISAGIAVILTYGATISSGYALTCGSMNVSGALTATSFSGNGSQLSNLPSSTAGTILGIYLIT